VFSSQFPRNFGHIAWPTSLVSISFLLQPPQKTVSHPASKGTLQISACYQALSKEESCGTPGSINNVSAEHFPMSWKKQVVRRVCAPNSSQHHASSNYSQEYTLQLTLALNPGPPYKSYSTFNKMSSL
jgi:hypothetical protein